MRTGLFFPLWICSVLIAGAQEQAVPDSMITDFLYKIQASINSHQSEFLENHIAIDQLVDRSADGLVIPENQREEFDEGIKQGANLGANIVDALGEDGYYTAMQFSASGDTMSGLFRLVGAAGLNYHEFYMRYGEDFEIFDLYVYSTGEMMSETMRKALEPILFNQADWSENLKRMGEAATGEKRRYLEDMAQIPLMKEALGAGEYQMAHDIYLQLGDKVRHQKTTRLLNINAVTQISDSLLSYYIEEYMADYPGDPSLNLLLIDYYFSAAEYDGALACIQTLQEEIPNDGYLEYLKATIYLTMDDAENFVLHAKKAIAYEPWVDDPYYNLLDYSLGNKDFAETRALMIALKENAEVIFPEETMATMALFADFLQSKEFAEMKATYYEE